MAFISMATDIPLYEFTVHITYYTPDQMFCLEFLFDFDSGFYPEVNVFIFMWNSIILTECLLKFGLRRFKMA